MNITLDQVSKRYGYQYILKDIALTIEDDITYGVAGPNGSGKSTFLKLVSGYLSPSEGSISYQVEGKKVGRDSIYEHISIAAPYIDLIGEYSLEEVYDFHRKFKKVSVGGFKEFFELLGYPYDLDLQFQDYSSGMQQRVKLALAILTKSSLLLLDEPTTYLDDNAREWFQNLLKNHLKGRTTILCSNDKNDFQHCTEILDVSDWK